MCVAGLLDAMRSKLPASARIVWMCLENHADHNRRWSISLESIVGEVNLSIETVVRAVRVLIQNGIVRGERDGPGRKATVWHMLRSYEPSPHNGGIEPEQTPQHEGMNGEKPPQSDGIEKRGSRQNAGISNPAKCGDLTHQVRKNPPKEAPFPSTDRAGDRAAQGDLPKWGRRKDGNNSRVLGTNPRALGTNPRAKGTNPRAYRNGFMALDPEPATIDGSAVDLDEFRDYHAKLRLIGGNRG